MIDAYTDLRNEVLRITEVDIFDRSRKGKIPEFRGAVMVAMIKYYGLSTLSIGSLMNMDHSSVVHHHAQHESRYRYDDMYADVYDSVCLVAAKNGCTDRASDLIEISKLMKIAFA